VFISHKLNEVMAISDRVLVLRHGKLTGERHISETDPKMMAALMVGQDVEFPQVEAVTPGEIRLELANISVRPSGSALVGAGVALKDLSLQLRGGEIVGLAGVSGNGQAVLASLIAGTLAPNAGAILIDGREI